MSWLTIAALVVLTPLALLGIVFLSFVRGVGRRWCEASQSGPKGNAHTQPPSDNGDKR